MVAKTKTPTRRTSPAKDPETQTPSEPLNDPKQIFAEEGTDIGDGPPGGTPPEVQKELLPHTTGGGEAETVDPLSPERLDKAVLDMAEAAVDQGVVTPPELTYHPPEPTGAPTLGPLVFRGLRMSQPFGAIVAALAKAQGGMGRATKKSTGQARGGIYSYADLSEAQEAILESFPGEGLAIIQGGALAGLEEVLVQVKDNPPEIITGARVVVTTVVAHSSGQWIETTMEALARDAFPQAVGAATTYLKRYGVSALCFVVTDLDDDAAAAQPNGRGRSPATQGTPTQGPGADGVAYGDDFTDPDDWHGGEVPTVPFGDKWKGTKVSELDRDTLRWFLTRAKEQVKKYPKEQPWLDAINREIARRVAITEADSG